MINFAIRYFPARVCPSSESLGLRSTAASTEQSVIVLGYSLPQAGQIFIWLSFLLC